MLRALARVDVAAIERNAALLARAAAPAALCAVVKADGYGHGAVPAARAAQAGGARWLAVATAAEAAELRGAGIGGPLLVMGALSPEELTVALRARADVVVWRQATVAELAEHPDADAAGIHVKLDSGMGRLGTRDAAEAERVASAVAAAPRLRLAGAMTHFATADDDPAFAREQLARFLAWAEPLRARHDGLLLHAANSAAALGIPEARLDLVRCGIGVYGMDPFGDDPARHGLAPALELVSYLAEVKPIAPGESAGYGRRFVAAAPTWIGTVPIGYGDGVRRALTNDCDVLVDGRRVPVVGTVSMDNITVDLGPDPPAPGVEVVLLGARGGRARAGRGVGAAARDDQLRDHVRDRPAGAARAPPRRGAGVSLLDDARALFAGTEAWIVGGAVRDRLLGRATTDLDLAVPEDPKDAARALARTTGGAAFRLSGAFGAWRVVGDHGAWHVDLVVLRDGDIGADLAARDFTVNAMAEPLAGGELLDPHGGRADLGARRLRTVGPSALDDDPLRALRAVRLAIDLDLTIAPETAAAMTRAAPGLERVAAERIFGELKQVIASPSVRTGLTLMDAHGLTAQVLPELVALRGVEQNEFHHLDVHDHTLAVLDEVVAIEHDPLAAGFGEHAGAVGALLREPLADELTRGQAMRFAALLHDAAKPWTRIMRDDGRVAGFPGHDREGAELARAVLRRLRASAKLADHVAALCLNHLRVGFLVHERPLGPRAIWRYLQATEPWSPEVTVFTVADRLATRGRNADAAIAAHVELARELLGPAFERRAAGRPAPLVRGDELARELGLQAGPRLGELLAQLEEDRYAGAIVTRDDAIRRARELAGG